MPGAQQLLTFVVAVNTSNNDLGQTGATLWGSRGPARGAGVSVGNLAVCSHPQLPNLQPGPLSFHELTSQRPL